MLFNICREIKAIFLAFARPAFITASDSDDAEMAIVASMAESISRADLYAASKD